MKMVNWQNVNSESCDFDNNLKIKTYLIDTLK